VISKGKPIVLCDIGRWSRQRNQIIKYDIWYLDTTPAAVCKDPVTLFIQTATDGNWWQLMATDGNWRQHNGSSVQKTVQMRDQLCRVTQCQVHSKSADTINTVRLTGTGLDTKLSYTIYDDRIIPILFTHWQMCKDNTSIAHTLTDVQNNSIGDSPVLPLPRCYPSENFSMRRHAGTGQQSSVRTSMLSSHLLPIQIFIFHDIRLSMLPD
jgi:hypothetical protein